MNFSHAPLDRQGNDLSMLNWTHLLRFQNPPSAPSPHPTPVRSLFRACSLSLSRLPKIKAICCLASLQSGPLRHVLWPLSFLPLTVSLLGQPPPQPHLLHTKAHSVLSLRPVSPWRLAPSSLGGLFCISPAPWLPGCLEPCPVTLSPCSGFPSETEVRHTLLPAVSLLTPAWLYHVCSPGKSLAANTLSLPTICTSISLSSPSGFPGSVPMSPQLMLQACWVLGSR